MPTAVRIRLNCGGRLKHKTGSNQNSPDFVLKSGPFFCLNRTGQSHESPYKFANLQYIRLSFFKMLKLRLAFCAMKYYLKQVYKKHHIFLCDAKSKSCYFLFFRHEMLLYTVINKRSGCLVIVYFGTNCSLLMFVNLFRIHGFFY